MTYRALATMTLALTAMLAGCGQNNQYAAPPPPKVTVALPVAQDVTRYFDATGNAAAVNSVDLVARVQGFVQAIGYTDGQFVKKGTSLFTIEPEPYRLKVDAAKASVTSAQATLTQAQAEYQRQAELIQKQVSTQANYDKALAHGLIGLFIGPIVLSIAWQLLVAWVGDGTDGRETAGKQE